MKKINTWLVGFEGFYGTKWAFPDSDLSWTIFDNPSDINDEVLEFVVEQAYDAVNNDDYETDVVTAIAEHISELAKEQLPGIVDSIEFQGISSPKFYNFRNDSGNVVVDCDIAKLKQAFAEHPDAGVYIKERYTSCDGFISHYENNLEDWLETFEDDSSHKVGAALNLLLDIDNEDLYSDVMESIYAGNYIDFDAVLEAVNDRYGTEFEDLEDLKNWTPVDIDELEFLARLCGYEGEITLQSKRSDIIPVKFEYMAELLN